MPAPAHSLCFSCIVFVAFIFVLSGSMNTLLDGRPVSWKQSMSFSAPAPDVQPASKMPVRFAIFCFHFSAILFLLSVLSCPMRLTTDDWCPLPPALQLGRTAGTSNFYFCLQRFLLSYLLLKTFYYLPSPFPVRLTLRCCPLRTSSLSNACLHWPQACSNPPTCETHAFHSGCTSSCFVWCLWCHCAHCL